MHAAVDGQLNHKRRWIAILLLVVLCMLPLFAPFISTLAAAEVTRFDSDGDQIVDTADIDDDNDGVPDLLEIQADGNDLDSDRDGIPNRLDLDSDNDGILDWQESGAGSQVAISTLVPDGGRLQGAVGDNGLIDLFEFPIDTGRLVYTLANSDEGHDALPDIYDLDSDNDGLWDTVETGVVGPRDNDRDGRIDAPPGTVGTDGIADFLQRINDATCCDITGDGVDDVIPRNSDGTDLPDFQDLDSDNDGVSDLLEAGGVDADNDGRVDSFVDVVEVDGVDDGLRALPLNPLDTNGNGVVDYLDPTADGSGSAFTTSGTVDLPDATDTTPTQATPVPGVTQQLADGPVSAVQTGLDASGCSIQSRSVDAVLILCVILSLTVLAWRFTLRRVRVE